MGLWCYDGGIDNAGTVIITVVIVAEQVVAQGDSCFIGKPDRIVVDMMAALNSSCKAHAVAGIGDCEYAVAEEEPDPETGGDEADCGPFVRHSCLWDGNG